jgi:pentapeptide MXKDX repeat protein
MAIRIRCARHREASTRKGAEVVMVRKHFGRYQIIRKLGRSMTDVYLALDPVLEKLVVLKLIEQSPDELTRIVIDAERRGVEIQKQLHEIDRRVLEVYDFGTQSGCFFVAMEYFEGRNVAEILQSERRLDARRACEYTLEVLSQIEKLHTFVSDVDGHRRAVVHGDIKPSNIQIGYNGQVRLVDFGIAKVITSTHHLTHHNLGSPIYCSPERLEKSQVDPQADLWAVGVSLYEMVSGALPYQSMSTRKLQNLIQSRRPPRALPASCPAPLRAIILKALGSQVQRRYSCAADFGDDLRAFLRGSPTVAEREPQPCWDANETVQKPRPGATRVPSAGFATYRPSPAPYRPPKLLRYAAGAIGAIALGFVIALFLIKPIDYFASVYGEIRALREPRDYTSLSVAEINDDWNRYQRLDRENAFLGSFSPASFVTAQIRARLIYAADAVIQKYRESSDPALANYEWSKARLCLLHALEIDGSDRKARGMLALCDGYLSLIRDPNLRQAEQIQKNFQNAAADLPNSPDPHLGLASLDTYVFHNAGKALSEFAEAERRGFRSGPRESEQQGDAFLFRADYEIRQARRAAGKSNDEQRRWLQQASNDLDRARSVYEPIAGFSKVNTGLDELYRRGQLIHQLNDAIVEAEQRAALQRARLQREALQREALQREALQKEALQKEALQKEALQKEALQKEALQKEALQKEALQKEALQKEALQREAQLKLAETNANANKPWRRFGEPK